jgi:hypothetical protein
LGFQLSQPNAKKNTKITVGGTGIILKINKYTISGNFLLH